MFKSLSNPQRKAVANGRHRLSATTPVPCLWHPEAPGPLWDGTRRVGRNQIEAYCRVVAREFKPEKIILFGSHACGKPTKDSDVDLVVICRFAGGGRKRDFKFKCRWTRPFHRTCWCGSRGSFHGCKVSIVKCWSVAK